MYQAPSPAAVAWPFDLDLDYDEGFFFFCGGGLYTARAQENPRAPPPREALTTPSNAHRPDQKNHELIPPKLIAGYIYMYMYHFVRRNHELIPPKLIAGYMYRYMYHFVHFVTTDQIGEIMN